MKQIYNVLHAYCLISTGIQFAQGNWIAMFVFLVLGVLFWVLYDITEDKEKI